MQLVVRTMLGVVLTTLCFGQVCAEETKSTWWPFGAKEEPTAPADAATPPMASEVAVADSDADSRFKWPSLPELTWPSFASESEEGTTPISPDATPKVDRRPSSRYTKAARPPRNSWAKKDPQAQPTEPATSPWQTVSEGARRVGDTTAAAWHKTVDAVTPGEDAPAATSAPVAQQQPSKSWWNWWGGDETEPEGPRTVTEWMAQDRLDP
jgi:hypothetical protein